MAIQTITQEITAYDYIVKNWNNYGIEALKSKQDMVELLNILQANEENLDTMHDVVINGTKDGFFCSIYGEWYTDTEIVETLQSLHLFFPSMEALQEYIAIRVEEYGEEVTADTINEEIEAEDIRRTRDGYVLKVWC